jgi:hypothetical protein
MQELAKLGLEVVWRDDDAKIAVRREWHWDCIYTRLMYVVSVVRVDVLSAERIEADRVWLASHVKELERGGLPRGMQKGVAVLPVYLAGRVEDDARAACT